MTTHGNIGGLTMRFSARALHEFLAGRIDGVRLRDAIIGGTAPFNYQLLHGHTIGEARIVSSGVDEDDDHIELSFGPDPAASPFKAATPERDHD
jgi:hypothetical protein